MGAFFGVIALARFGSVKLPNPGRIEDRCIDVNNQIIPLGSDCLKALLDQVAGDLVIGQVDPVE